jgi:2',3'-cyclic-nucleotide 2'-phosphodiesterase/3'-nucleotidase
MGFRTAALFSLFAAAMGCHGTNGSTIPSGAAATFGVLEVTDTHTNIRSYDYFKLAEDKTIGLERTATLIKSARTELPDSILVDNGDTIQGTVLGDYQALISPVPCSQTLAIYKTLNALGVDIGGIGNHEFNYGLGFLAQVTHTAFDVDGVDTASSKSCMGPSFPQILSNVFSMKTSQTLFPASMIITREVTASLPNGKTMRAPLKLGFIDFTPPPILGWDKRWLDGKVFTKGAQEVAPGLITELRNQGADLIVAIIHGGLDNSPYAASMENQAWYLAQIAGIDVMLMGHSHDIFPKADSKSAQFSLPMVDKQAGSVAGVPALMANFWGQHLGVIKLALRYDGTSWTVDRMKTVVEARPITTSCMGGAALACMNGQWQTGAQCPFSALCTNQADKTKVFVDADASVAPLVDAEHQATITYVKTPIGTSDFEMSTFFAEEGDVSAVELVNQAQTAYVINYVKQSLPQYAALPVLSVSAPFKSGYQGGNDYTDVPAGNIAINNAADLYLYANTLYAVKVSGATLKDWLETAATRFATIDPTETAEQKLINPGVQGYNFDMPSDPNLTYQIDVTQPLPAMGTKASGRIVNLMYKGAPIDPNAEFIVATNNYRASGGGNFPGLDGSKTIIASPDSSRDVLIAYIKSIKNVSRAANGADRSWRFKPVTTAGPVTFTSAQNALPRAQAAGLSNISLVQQDDKSGKGLSIYAIDLSK